MWDDWWFMIVDWLILGWHHWQSHLKIQLDGGFAMGNLKTTRNTTRGFYQIKPTRYEIPKPTNRYGCDKHEDCKTHEVDDRDDRKDRDDREERENRKEREDRKDRGRPRRPTKNRCIDKYGINKESSVLLWNPDWLLWRVMIGWYSARRDWLWRTPVGYYSTRWLVIMARGDWLFSARWLAHIPYLLVPILGDDL
jgi:hypothetical protein